MYLKSWSDEDHGISAAFIQKKMKEDYGISVDRHSIYRCMDSLRNYANMNIQVQQGGRYHLIDRYPSLDDIRLIAECVHAAKFLPQEEEMSLLEILADYCSEYQRQIIEDEVWKVNRTSIDFYDNYRSVLDSLDVIRTAIHGNPSLGIHGSRKISFRYFTYRINDLHTSAEKRPNKKYTASPYKLILDEGFYYLLAYDSAAKHIFTYRVDRMHDVSLIDEACEGQDAFKQFDLNSFSFSMFSGTVETITLRFSESLLDSMIDRFGTGDNVKYKRLDREFLSVTTSVHVSSPFWGWLTGFGDKIQIISPNEVASAFRNHLTTILNSYSKE